MIHLAFLVGQLAGAISAGFVHYVGRLYLQITALAGLVEEESLESALETCHLADIERETGAGNLDAEVKINQIIFLEQIPVARSVFGKFGHGASFFDYHVVSGILAFGHVVVGYVRDGEQYVCHILLCLCHNLLQSLVGTFELGNLFLGRIGLVLLAVFHQLAYLLGQQVLLLLVVV